jgi:hypothetical protein
VEKFGAWTVDDGRGKYRHATCQCGKQKQVLIASLRSGKSKSCGCAAQGRKRPDKFKHGWIGTPTYCSWVEMRRRCRAAHRPEFVNYGARGISVCDEWAADFSAFLRDMGERPQGHSIDRIDNAKGYQKDNCRWAPVVVQARNRRGNRMITYRSQTMTIAEAAEIAGLRHATVRDRIGRNWSVEEAVETPTLPQGVFAHPGKPGPKPGFRRDGVRGKKIS